MAVEQCFAHTYEDARDKFLAAAEARGLRIERHVHPHAVGPAGESLSIDTALFAPQRAQTLLIVTSGVHGVEGFAVPAARSACCMTTHSSRAWWPPTWRCCSCMPSTRTGLRTCAA